MYGCGLRVSEATTLTVNQIDGAQGVLRLIGKGNKERLLPLPLPLLTKLREFWKTHRHPLWLFPNPAMTGSLHPKSLYRAFRTAVGALGLPKTIVPHSLRHSYATHLMDYGVEMRVVQLLLGHSSMKSTEVYTHLTEPRRERLRLLLNDLMAGL